MVDGGRVRVQADLENVVVVGRYPETRHEAVDVQIQILAHDALASGEWLTVGWRVE